MKQLLSGFLAGICISIGGSIYLMAPNKVIGSVLFSVALLSICFLGLSLYTGKIGFAVYNYSKRNIYDLMLCLVGNMIGVVLIGILSKGSIDANIVEALCHNKLNVSLSKSFFNACMCGVLMYIAVYSYKVKNTVVGILFCIPTFILCGFEHVVADVYYLALNGVFSIKVLLFVFVVLLGNTAGSILFSLIHSKIR